MPGRPSLASLALACALGIASPALPQDVEAPCRLCNPGDSKVEEQPSQPVRLEVETRLDFDRLILMGPTGGSAELGPDGSRTVSGSVAAISSKAMIGEVLIRGEPGRTVRIELPQSIELSGFNGGSIRLESIRSDLPPLSRLDPNGQLSFRFGGIVRLSGDVDGEFRGDVPINVEYL